MNVLRVAFLSAAVASQADIQLVDVFVPHKGVSCYRIPVLTAVRSDGTPEPPGFGLTLLAFAEARIESCNDGGRKAIALRRSTDLGATWGATTLLVPDGADVKDGLNLGAVVQSEGAPGSLPKVQVFYCYCAHVCPVASTFVIESHDAGLTWSNPHNLTDILVGAGVGLFAPGPDHGVAVNTKDLVVCGWYRTLTQKPGSLEGALCLLSDDSGETFKVGGKIPQNNGVVLNECQPVQLKNGSILMNSRNEGQASARAFAISNDGGATFSAPWVRPDLVDPHCQGSMVRMGVTDQLVLSNAKSATRRENMAITTSQSEGAQWNLATDVWSGPSAYSSLAILFDSPAHGGVNPPAVGLLFERGDVSPYEKITFTFVRVVPPAPKNQSQSLYL